MNLVLERREDPVGSDQLRRSTRLGWPSRSKFKGSGITISYSLGANRQRSLSQRPTVPTYQRTHVSPFPRLLKFYEFIKVIPRQIRFPVFQKCIGYPVCLAIDELYPFQVPVFEKYVDHRCTLKSYLLKIAVFKGTILNRSTENNIGEL